MKVHIHCHPQPRFIKSLLNVTPSILIATQPTEEGRDLKRLDDQSQLGYDKHSYNGNSDELQRPLRAVDT